MAHEINTGVRRGGTNFGPLFRTSRFGDGFWLLRNYLVLLRLNFAGADVLNLRRW